MRTLWFISSLRGKFGECLVLQCLLLELVNPAPEQDLFVIPGADMVEGGLLALENRMAYFGWRENSTQYLGKKARQGQPYSRGRRS
jgi:hypothetical protein